MSAIALAALLMAGATLAAPSDARQRLPLPRSRKSAPAAATAAAAVVSLLVMSATPSLVVSFLIASAAILTRRRRRRRATTRHREGQALAAALEVLIGALKIGAHPMSAFAIAGTECGGPVGRRMRAIAARAELGADVSEGIRTLAGSSAVPEYWDRLAVFWRLAAEHGLAMSDLMRAAHRDIVDRQRFADRMHAALAGARATAVILASLPALGVLLGQLIGADPTGYLLGGGLGGVLLVGGVTLSCLGVAWADRIADRLRP